MNYGILIGLWILCGVILLALASIDAGQKLITKHKEKNNGLGIIGGWRDECVGWVLPGDDQPIVVDDSEERFWETGIVGGHVVFDSSDPGTPGEAGRG